MNQEDIPWVQLIWQAHYNDDKLPQVKGQCGSFWWKDCLSIWDSFVSIVNIKAGTGKTIRFWMDNWMDTNLLEEFPHLFSFSKNKDISLMKFISVSQENIFDHFHLPLSLIAAQECEELTEAVQLHLESNIDAEDQWEFDWKGGYSCKKVY